MKRTLARIFGRERRPRGGTAESRADPALEAFVLRMPKVELEVRLESYVRPHSAFGDSPAELAALALAAVRQAFLAEAERETFDSEFRREFADLGRRWLQAAVEVG